MTKLKINHDSYKIGMNEVEGLKQAITKVMQPIVETLKESVYWNGLDLSEVEYKSRDGFSAFSSNLGGMQLRFVIPKCEEGSLDLKGLEFGECDECNGETQCGYEGQECAADNDGYLDASLRIWFKLEEIDLDTGEMKFWLYMGGGNGDAPYFRAKYEKDLFDVSFTAKSIAGVERQGKIAVAKLLKLFK